MGCVALLVLACDPSPPPRDGLTAETTRKTRPDSSSLYADPALVPSRDGEHARRELALAGDASTLLEALPEIRRAEVVVRLPAPRSGTRDEEATPNATVVLELDGPDAESEAVRARALRILRGAIDPRVAVQLELLGPSAGVEGRADGHGPRAVDFGLALALLGFGLSAGILLERMRRRRHPGSAQPR